MSVESNYFILVISTGQKKENVQVSISEWKETSKPMIKVVPKLTDNSNNLEYFIRY